MDNNTNNIDNRITDKVLTDIEVNDIENKFKGMDNKRKKKKVNKEDTTPIQGVIDDIQPKKNHGHLWVKGESGNTKGRPPKGTALSDILRDLGQKKVEVTDRETGKVSKKVRNTLLAQRLWDAALEDKASIGTIREVFDRIDGKVTEKREVTVSKISDKLPDHDKDDEIIKDYTTLQ